MIAFTEQELRDLDVLLNTIQQMHMQGNNLVLYPEQQELILKMIRCWDALALVVSNFEHNLADFRQGCLSKPVYIKLEDK